MKIVHVPWLASILAVATAPSFANDVILHERIRVDPRDDIALGVVIEGDIPAALETRSGLVSSPDPARPPNEREASATRDGEASVGGTFTPDRNTARPQLLPYEDPFVPSTTPFKRLVAYDAVDSHFSLYVANVRLTKVRTVASPDERDDRFYANLVIDTSAHARVRIPSVGPDAQVVHGRLGVGARDLSFQLLHDSADNWFLDASESVRARLILDLAVSRASFGGDFGDPGWEDLQAGPAVPPNVRAAAEAVAAHIGIRRGDRPGAVVSKLVAYFRAFRDSEDPPKVEHDIYTDLALSQKGVCRHRSYTFMITAVALGLPTRMVANEAHAWVEVQAGALWKRIDLGGAGNFSRSESVPSAEPYLLPSDPFAWPPNAARGEAAAPSASSRAERARLARDPTTHDAQTGSRPVTILTLSVVEEAVVRGSLLHIQGTAFADRAPCANLLVDLVLRDPKSLGDTSVGAAATDASGNFSTAIALPGIVSTGDYDVVAMTSGDRRCGATVTE